MKKSLSLVLALTALAAYGVKPEYIGEEKIVTLEGTVYTPSGEDGPYANTQMVSGNGLIKTMCVFAGSAVSEMGVNFQYSPEYSPVITDIEEADGAKVVSFVGYLDETGDLKVGGGPAIYSTPASYSSSTGKIEFKDGLSHYILYCGFNEQYEPERIYKAYEILGIEYYSVPYPQVQAVGKYARLTNEDCKGPWILKYRQVYGPLDVEPVGSLAVSVSSSYMLSNSATLNYELKWINGKIPEGQINYSISIDGDNGFEPITTAAHAMTGSVELTNLQYFQPYNFFVIAMADIEGEKFESPIASIVVTSAVADGIEILNERVDPSNLWANVCYSVEPGNVSAGVPLAILIAGNNGFKARKIMIDDSEGDVLVDGLEPETDYIFHIQPCAYLGGGFVATGPVKTVNFTTLQDTNTKVDDFASESGDVRYYNLNGIEITKHEKGEIVIERNGSNYRLIIK